MTILVLGATGMLGSVVYRYFKNCYDCTVIGTSRERVGELIPFNVRNGFDDFLIDLKKIDYIINCIGITKPYCHDDNPEEIQNAVRVNTLFPFELARIAEENDCRVIQIATDCVFSGSRGKYTEHDVHDATDVYGKTKSLGEVRSPRFLNIRCSIIGPEQYHKTFLLEWFLSQPDGSIAKGFTHHKWNGVTTLQFAQLCKEVIFKNKFDELTGIASAHHFLPNEIVSKYDLLHIFNKVYGKNVKIEKFEDTNPVDRTLATVHTELTALFPKTSMEKAVADLRDFERLGTFEHHTTCRFCSGNKLTRILDFGNVPLAGGFLKEQEIKDEKYYPLKIHFCEDCFLVQVNNVIDPQTLFKDYFYFSSAIKTLVDHCGTWASEMYDRFLKNRNQPSVFEIGCNDGVMLKPFAAFGVKAVGMDPATNVVRSVEQKGFTIINDFFGERTARFVKEQHGQFDAITSSFSFAHIDNMISVIKGVKRLLKDDGVFVFEVYYLGTLIEEMQYDMIYHEHCSYYSLLTLKKFLGAYGMEVFDVTFTPGVRSGAVRFYVRNIGVLEEPISEAVKELEREEIAKGYDKAETFFGYASKIEKTKRDLIALLDRLKGEGKKIIGYGASGRGTMIMNYCRIDGTYLDYVVDDASAKHGYYTPGTHVQIKPWEATEKDPSDYALLFAWSFIDEVVKKRQDFLQKGGKFIVPLPEVRIVEGVSPVLEPIASYKSPCCELSPACSHNA